MNSNSEPVAAAAAYDLVISDELMSPESDVATRDRHVREIDKDIPLVSTALPTIATTPSMENVLLDPLPMDESIDLGSESVLDQSVHSVPSVSRLDEENLPETDDSNVKTDHITYPDEQLHADDTNNGHVHFDDIVSPSDEMENEPSTEVLLDENKETLVLPESTTGDSVSEQLNEACSEFDRVVRFSEERSPERDDAHEVEFVEEKGIQPADSSRCLSKFFENEDNVGGTDVEGKSFFDSFATGDKDPITPSPKVLEPASVLPSLSMPHVSLSSSLSSAGATPSPVHRISDPLSPFPGHHQNSASEGSASEADPFSAGVFANDVDRRHDAWIPSESTRLVLVSILTNAALPTHRTCSPHIIVEEPLVCILIIIVYF